MTCSKKVAALPWDLEIRFEAAVESRLVTAKLITQKGRTPNKTPAILGAAWNETTTDDD